MAPEALTRESYAGSAYAGRAYALRNFILPLYRRQPFHEVIVSGVWAPEPRDPYTVLFVPTEHHNILDIVSQRQAGYKVSTGDVLLYQGDDHVIFDDIALVEPLMRALDADVLVPARWTRLNRREEPSNDGRMEAYVPFHCAFYRRHVMEVCPWGELLGEPHSLDVRHSEMMKKKGVRFQWTDELRAWDIELPGVAACVSS